MFLSPYNEMDLKANWEQVLNFDLYCGRYNLDLIFVHFDNLGSCDRFDVFDSDHLDTLELVHLNDAPELALQDTLDIVYWKT